MNFNDPTFVRLMATCAVAAVILVVVIILLWH